MRRKDASVILDLTPDATEGLAIAATVYQRFGLAGVITSAKDGRHSTGSLHYSGNAFDLRLPSRCMPQPWNERAETLDYVVQEALIHELGDDWDVVLEKHQQSPWDWHIHVENQPKG